MKQSLSICAALALSCTGLVSGNTADGGIDAGAPADSGADAGVDVGTVCDRSQCSFELATPFTGQPPRACTDVVAIDLNRDSNVDLVWASQPGPTDFVLGGIDVSLNVGGGAFNTSTVIESLTDAWTFAATGDVDGDGVSDVITSRPARTRSEVMLFRARDGGLAQDPTAFPLLTGTDAGFVFGRVALADLDGDGDLDVYVPVSFDLGFTTSQASHLMMNDGAGHFTDAPGLPALRVEQDYTFCATAADFTGDGRADIFAGGGLSSPRLLVGQTGGTFRDESDDAGRVPPLVMRAYSCQAVDIDADGDGDVVVINDGLRDVDGGPNLTANYLFRNDGTGHFSSLQFPTAGPFDTRGFAMADLNGDGRLDVIFGHNAETVSHQGHAIEILLQVADAGFEVAKGVANIDDNIFGMAVGDFNHDGLPDVALSRSKENDTATGSLKNAILWGRRITP